MNKPIDTIDIPWLTDMYEQDEDFKRYVDRYCTKHQIPVKEALTHVIVQDVASGYLNKPIMDDISEIQKHIELTEGKSC